MDACDISLVKEEIVELIKTEPQNEYEFDICGQSEIKTEDSNLVGDFKDTINYEAQRFQILDVEMKSPWEGFLPIKEQIKDETDTSNSVHEIVKTEIKLNDSSLGIMDSNIYHFTLVDKSEIKLEQDQSTSSSKISQSNIFAQTSSDFNLNSECVNENQDLSFNAIQKKAEYRNLLLKHSKLGGFSVSTQAIKTKCNLENYTKKGGLCIVIALGSICKTKNCSKYALKGGIYFEHIEKRKCKTENCSKKAQLGGHCNKHGGGRKCKTENCTKGARVKGHCNAHGGINKCKFNKCTKVAPVGGHCIKHGGGRKCKTNNCTKYALKGGNCFEHGGGKKCNTENCINRTKVGENCIAHGGEGNVDKGSSIPIKE